ncbi:hypothetical protein ACHAWF_002417 [Thalassiosira exigua]
MTDCTMDAKFMDTTMHRSLRPSKRLAAALLLLVAITSAGSTSCPAGQPSKYKSSNSKPPLVSFSTTEANVEIIDINPSAFAPRESFYGDWAERFPPSSPLLNYHAKDDPERALEAVHDAYAFVARWLPPPALARLAAFPFRKSGPSALVMRGLPIDADVPPTPAKASVFDDSAAAADGRSALVPVAESWLLGVARVLGLPVAAPYSNGDRGGLVRDITQNPGDVGDLPMHRDYPAIARNPDAMADSGEPELLLLLGVRSDPGDGGGKWARTVVMDSARLMEAISSEDEATLRTKKILVEFRLPNGDFVPVSEPFYPILDDEDGVPVVTLHNLPRARHSSPDGGDAAVEAYGRVSQMAFDLGELVTLGPGDLLIIHNSRLVHGRTRFGSDETRSDGTGRWLVKSYVSNRLWRVPGSPFGGFAAYPTLSATDWRMPGE